MKRRILALVLAAAVGLGWVTAASAAGAEETQETQEEQAIQVLAALNVMTGDEHGELHLERFLTRAELTKLAVACSVWRDSVGAVASVKPYPDVDRDAWYAPYVELARDKGLVEGNTAGTFEPEREITLAEAATLVLRLLGYQGGDLSGAWPAGQMAMYRALKLDKNISRGQEEAVTRRDALYLFYNLLTAKTKSGQVYFVTLGHTLTAAGEIDRVALVNSAMEGPAVAQGQWQQALPFSLSGRARIYRDGAETTAEAVREGDVLYWSAPMRSLWAFSGRVTGTYTAATPSQASPSAVTVGGRSYTIETPSAAYALSDLGEYRLGQTVTLLLGRSGGVAAVRTPRQGSVAARGVVSGVTTAAYQDAGGRSYTDDAVEIIATDGTRRSFRGRGKELEAGDLVYVTVAEQGYAIEKLSPASLSGRVSRSADAVDELPLAKNVEILDTYGTRTALAVTPQRLAGVRLTGNMVRWYGLNEAGEIAWLILRDVTGDVHRYGVLTDVEERNGGFTAVGPDLRAVYTYETGGVSGTYTGTQAIWNLQKGPCQIKQDGGGIDRIWNLKSVELDGVEEGKGYTAGRSYTLSGNTAAYILRSGRYYPVQLEAVSGEGYTLTGWYDKDESAGGRIRVVVAQERAD